MNELFAGMYFFFCNIPQSQLLYRVELLAQLYRRNSAVAIRLLAIVVFAEIMQWPHRAT